MPLHPLLQPGLEAYLEGDFGRAEELWGRLAGELEGNSARTCRALSDLSAALAEPAAGEAAARWEALGAELAALPEQHLGVDLLRLREDLPATLAAARANPPEVRSPPRVSRRALLRFAAFVVVVAAAALAVRFTPLANYLDREALEGLTAGLRESWWAPLLLIVLGAVLFPLGFPATPLIVAGALVFGGFWGSLYNLIASLAGAVTCYAMARTLGAELLQGIGGARLKRIEKQLARRGFGYLIGVRFLPIPYPAVNFAMALAGVRFVPYLLATTIGLVPAITIWTFFYASAAETAVGSGELTPGDLGPLFLILSLLATVSFLPQLLQQLSRRRRYRRLREERRGR